MIKFFRRIRHTLLSENKFSKYLVYAVGEIVLVVIGILIALQLNQMYQNGKDREKEMAYLREINLDFQSNKVQLDSIIQNNKNALAACKRLQYHIAQLRSYPPEEYKNYPFKDSMMHYQTLGFKNKSFNPKNGTVQALINSSSFDLIQNDSLRRALISWNDVLSDYLEEEQFAMDILFKEYYPWVRMNYDYERIFNNENMALWAGRHESNFRIDRIGNLEYLLKTVNEEGIVKMIDDILMLTETDN